MWIEQQEAIDRLRVVAVAVNGPPALGNPANRFPRVINQKIAGGAAPEMVGKHIAVARPSSSGALDWSGLW